MPGSSPGPLLMWQWEGLLVSFPVMAYGFTAHADYLNIYTEMQEPNIRRFTKVTDAVCVWRGGVLL